MTIFPFSLQIPILFYPTIKRISVLNPRDFADRVTLVPTTTTAEIEGGTLESSNTGKTQLGNQVSVICVVATGLWPWLQVDTLSECETRWRVGRTIKVWQRRQLPVLSLAHWTAVSPRGEALWRLQHETVSTLPGLNLCPFVCPPRSTNPPNATTLGRMDTVQEDHFVLLHM